MALVSAWLPPTQFSLRFEDLGHPRQGLGDPLRHLRRETSARRRDHFCIGRLFQPTRLLHARDESAREAILDGLVAAYRETWAWARPWLPDALRRGGLRPVGAADLDALGGAAGAGGPRRRRCGRRRGALQPPVLELAARGARRRGRARPRARRPPGRGRPRRPVARVERLSLELYFRRSMVRADRALAQAHGELRGLARLHRAQGEPPHGRAIELTERERRFPLLLPVGPRVPLPGRSARTARGAPS